MTLVKIKLDVKDAAYISANPTKVLALNEPIYRNDGLVAYGDGVTPLSGLTFLPLFSGGGISSVVGTTNRISVDATDPANPIVDIDPDYDTAITNAIAAAVNAKKVYVSLIHSVGSNSVNPADANYYYFGMLGISATNTVGDTATNLREYGCPVTGVIKQAAISIRITNGGSVSTENSTLSIRNTTTNVLHTVTTTFNYNTGNNAIINKAVVVTGLNIAVTAGDQLMSVIGAPSWVTNPLGIYWTVQYLIELP